MTSRSPRIAIVQTGPVYFDLPKSLEKLKDILSNAGKEKADIVVFGECWLTGYPIWLDVCPDVNLWDSEPVKEVWARMYHNALDIKSSAWNTLINIIAESGMIVIMGANEKISSGRGNSSLYNSIFTFNETGHLLNHHRKLMPTYTERLVHTQGDGFGLKSVDTSFGRIGSLICWEHWMPLTRQAMHDESEDIHFALWPQVKKLNRVASQHYAFEGRCYVVAVGQLMQAKELPSELDKPANISDNDFIMNGGSCIYGPDGSEILSPQSFDKEIIYFDKFALEQIVKERMNLAVSGSYQRPQVFDFNVDKKRIF